ncbi:hypothetical protein Poli38472_003903 [Pythium oligandrum]|uniref:Transmembrane protein n=1 Tax=Pythium oligandrum TaxID=41045 RepID=A0A8K1CNH5_PYTOL|nr:hypothetical protein Poli38472_003903 [Pythium oligandrum]|eukprot:TMW66138.1 hypothetical protein Poli38472_003903 [Pythium oligandrum]
MFDSISRVAAAAEHAENDKPTPVKVSLPPEHSKRDTKITWQRVLHLVHRVFVFAAAWWYIIISFQASYASMELLRGHDNSARSGTIFPFPVMTSLVGAGPIRTSSLVKTTFGDDMTPRDSSIFVVSDGQAVDACPLSPDNYLYTNEFMRAIFTTISRDTAYNITALDEATMELIAPIIDCTYVLQPNSGITGGRLFYLARERANPDRVFLVVVSLIVQQYSISAQAETGPAAVGMVQVIYDMREPSVTNYYVVAKGFPVEEMEYRVYEYLNTTPDGQWTLRSIPSTKSEFAMVLITSIREGFYIKAPSEQSNINNQVWLAPSTPSEAVGIWHFVYTPVLRDSWAWVHGVQFIIGIRLLGNLVILCLTAYNNLRARKLWIGAAFVSISTSQVLNVVLVLVSWFMNEYWSLHEYSVTVGYAVIGLPDRLIHDTVMHADLLTLYFGACGLIGSVFRERIDPLLAMALFEIGYDRQTRINLLINSHHLHAKIQAFAYNFYMRGVLAPLNGQDKISPMVVQASHNMGKRDYDYVAVCLFPVFLNLVWVVAYAILRKIYRRIFPPKVLIQQNTTGTARSGNEESILAQKRVHTLFELATGAELENRYGLVSDYDTCIFIRGTKFASADGIYSNGFVIANKKYLVQASDIWTIVAMKLLRSRFTNVYVYEVNGTTVQPTALLVYPHTLTVRDLLNLSVSMLS